MVVTVGKGLLLSSRGRDQEYLPPPYCAQDLAPMVSRTNVENPGPRDPQHPGHALLAALDSLVFTCSALPLLITFLSL